MQTRVLSLAVCTAALALAAGCNQSLFDSDPGDDDHRDASAGSDDGDADGSDDDSGGDADAGVPEPDAAPVAVCPAPCSGDAFDEFATIQGDRWNYLADVGATNGIAYEPMTYRDFGGLQAWAADSEVGPAIATCGGENADDPACAGLDGFVLMIPGGPGGDRASLSFRVPETAGYRLSGAMRVASGGAVDVPVTLIVSRVGRHDAISVRTPRTSEDEVALDAVFPGIQGEEILVTVGSDEELPPIGLRVFFTRIDEGEDAFPTRCQVAVRFDEGAPLEDDCRGAMVENLNDDIGPAGTSVPGPGPSERLGQGRVLSEGQYLAVGNSPLDYSGDFTIQFWAQTFPPNFTATAYADWNDAVRGGVAMSIDYDDNRIVYVCRMENGSVAGDDDCVQAMRPSDAEWHFWRAVRSKTSSTFTLCIDGQEIVRIPVPAGADLTSDEPPRLGRNVVYNPAYFNGSLDEVRVFSEALPCTTN